MKRYQFITATILIAISSLARGEIIVSAPEKAAAEDMKTFIEGKWEGSYVEKIDCQQAQNPNPGDNDIFVNCDATFFMSENKRVVKYDYSCAYFYEAASDGSGYILGNVECVM